MFSNLYLLPRALPHHHQLMVEHMLYRRLAAHYRDAIASGAIKVGERLPSIRVLMRRHAISLATALAAYRLLEREGWLEARPRSGNFARRPLRAAALREPNAQTLPRAAQFVGIHARVSSYVMRCQQQRARIDLSCPIGAPSLYPVAALKNAALRMLRRHPMAYATRSPLCGNAAFRAVLALRATECGMTLAPDEIIVTHGCIEA